MSSSSSSSPPPPPSEKNKSVNELYIAVLDKKTHELCEKIWTEREDKAKAFKEILARHPDITPEYNPEEDVPPLTVELEFDSLFEYLENKGDTTFTLSRTDYDRGFGHRIYCTFARDGSVVRQFEGPYHSRNNSTFFGVPISYQQGADYLREDNQIIIGQYFEPGKDYIHGPNPGVTDVHEVDDVVMSDHLDPALEKEAYVSHIGAVPYSIIHDENDHYESYLVRNMRTQERHFFVFPIEHGSYTNGTPLILRGEFFFTVANFPDDEVEEFHTHIMHARSHRIVHTWETRVDNTFAACTDFVVFTRDIDDGDEMRVTILS